MGHAAEHCRLALHLRREQRVDAGLRRARGPQLSPLPLGRRALRLEGVLVPRGRQRRFRLDQVRPLEPRRVVQGGDVRLPRLGVVRRPGLVRHVRGVVLVGQPGEVVPELVDEHVLGEAGVGRRGCLEVEDAAAAVLRLVDEDLDELVRRGRGRVAQGAVVVRQEVALGVEDVVLGRERRAPELAGARAGDAGVGRREVEAPDVEVAAPAAERLLVEERLGQPPGVAVELVELLGRVALAEDEEVDLFRRRAALDQRPDLSQRLAIGGVDEAGVGIDDRRPDLVEALVRVPHLQDDLHRVPRPRKAERLVERAVQLARCRRRLPLAVDRGEAARVDHPVRPAVDHLEEVLAQVEVVDEEGAAAGPRPVGHHLVERDDLRARAAAVEVVDAHGPVEEVTVEPGAGLLLARGARRRETAPVRGAGHENGRDHDGGPARN